jgi:hypothetical protein
MIEKCPHPAFGHLLPVTREKGLGRESYSEEPEESAR